MFYSLQFRLMSHITTTLLQQSRKEKNDIKNKTPILSSIKILKFAKNLQ